MQYHQLTSEERFMFSLLRKQGCSVSGIAQQLGRHRSTLYRELNRNSCHRTDGAYRPSKAHRRALSRRYYSQRNTRFYWPEYELVESYLRERWSPEQVSGYLRLHQVLQISHETIYRHIWRDKRSGGDLWTYLRGSQKQRRKRYRSHDSRGRMGGKRHISERPKSINQRLHKGHWEIDTVMGKGSKACIVTLVERKTGYTLIGKMPNRTTEALNDAVLMLMCRYRSGRFKTITADNGTEFHQYQQLEHETGVRFYFATPYHSWERGTNENTNGLIRQYIPKGKNMASVTQRECDAIANELNRRPRKRLGYKSPIHCFLNC
ncbi:IS30 family transposase [Parendozoicomonas haliclonae]|uniref:Integrase core domain protein n=1 Tax=Parendozoicomonas haliclonae TaxID=1960125 RepID=A0A1X7AU83_9GAMM|nr:IS30 family transposase [Parendozoicomonas haliclonae]SMA50987.1 Integrase core domain protein [Parendozoicomonas haliclonae]